MTMAMAFKGVSACTLHAHPWVSTRGSPYNGVTSRPIVEYLSKERSLMFFRAFLGSGELNRRGTPWSLRAGLGFCWVRRKPIGDLSAAGSSSPGGFVSEEIIRKGMLLRGEGESGNVRFDSNGLEKQGVGRVSSLKSNFGSRTDNRPEGEEQSGTQPTNVRGMSRERVPGFTLRIKGNELERYGTCFGGIVKARVQAELCSCLNASIGKECEVAVEDHCNVPEEAISPSASACNCKDGDRLSVEEGCCNSREDHFQDLCASGERSEIRIDPTLRSNNGQRLQVSSDGKDQADRYNSGEMAVEKSTRGLEEMGAAHITQRWFPYDDSFELDEETTLTSAAVLEMLDPFLVDGRKLRIESVVANRTYSVCPVVEGLLDLGNISAVFRTADALGFQSVHVVSNDTKRRYKKNRKVSAGAEKWLDVEMWETTDACIAALRARGYRIAVTHVASDTVSILDMDWTVPTAVFFGNEYRGVSAEAIALSDVRCSIPMSGMVDSFNVSVAAGILMHHAAHDRIARAGSHGDLTPEDQQVLQAEFSLRHNRRTVQILNRLVEMKEGGERSGSLGDLLKGGLANDIEEPNYLRVS